MRSSRLVFSALIGMIIFSAGALSIGRLFLSPGEFIWPEEEKGLIVSCMVAAVVSGFLTAKLAIKRTSRNLISLLIYGAISGCLMNFLTAIALGMYLYLTSLFIAPRLISSSYLMIYLILERTLICALVFGAVGGFINWFLAR